MNGRYPRPTKCSVPGCGRERAASESGAVYAYCEADTRAALRRSFGAEREPQAWHERAKAGTLPSQIVGGISD